MHISNICLQFNDRIINIIYTDDLNIFNLNSQLTYIHQPPNILYINKNLLNNYILILNGISMINDHMPYNQIVSIKFQPNFPLNSSDNQVYLCPIYNDIGFKFYENKLPIKLIFNNSTDIIIDNNYESCFLYFNLVL